MNWVFCLLCGGHTPMRTSISTTRIFCRRCGRELQDVAPQPPLQRDDAPTTITPRQYATLRAFGRLAPPASGMCAQQPPPAERPQEEQPRACGLLVSRRSQDHWALSPRVLALYDAKPRWSPWPAPGRLTASAGVPEPRRFVSVQATPRGPERDAQGRCLDFNN
jgi:hypothetical protein